METLIIIDPQNDFCDERGTLYVGGSDKALKNIIQYIKDERPERIIVTLDTHSPLHMDLAGGWNRQFDSLPCFNPDPKDCEFEESAKRLRDLGYPLVVWPDHCIKGSWGHSLPDCLMSSLIQWQKETGQRVEFIEKGYQDHEEMYSAFSVLGEDTITLPNWIEKDKITMVGFALDYCVKYSYLDLKKAGMNISLYLPGTAAIGETEKYWEGE